ncbi:MAG TPA: DUF4097 family beta strand repeat-containing protein [Polyangia bacterium]|nr:DUF4097 family beta strand repeat-containing protein [Polyangia bacterium]
MNRAPRWLSALTVALARVCASGFAHGADGGTSAPPAAAPVTERREIVVPMPGGEMVRIDNALGRIAVRGSGEPGKVHIIAEKRAPSGQALGRLRVHYTAWENGEIHIDTRVELAGGERSLPLSGSSVDLVVEVPPEIAVEAKTFGGDISASGLRAGARLETTGGRIGVSDVRGGVVTRQLQGGQTVASVDGDIDLDGVEGDMDLRRLSGGRLDARLVDGRIRAEDVRSALVRLTATTGDVIFVGLFRPSCHYDLRSYAGDVRVVTTLAQAPVPFELRARSAAPIEAALPLRTLSRQGDRTRAFYSGGRRGAAAAGTAGASTALVELSSVLGRVVIQPQAQPHDGDRAGDRASDRVIDRVNDRAETP